MGRTCLVFMGADWMAVCLGSKCVWMGIYPFPSTVLTFTFVVSHSGDALSFPLNYKPVGYQENGLEVGSCEESYTGYPIGLKYVCIHLLDIVMKSMVFYAFCLVVLAYGDVPTYTSWSKCMLVIQSKLFTLDSWISVCWAC
ncbi:hypothetical protein Tco_1454974 [Tanacetum coccineum]